MAPVKSVKLTCPINRDEIRALYKRERDPDRKIQLLGLYHTTQIQDCQSVAESSFSVGRVRAQLGERF